MCLDSGHDRADSFTYLDGRTVAGHDYDSFRLVQKTSPFSSGPAADCGSVSALFYLATVE